MRQHPNAKLTPRGREQMVRRVIDLAESPQAVATACGLCAKTVRKWVSRYRQNGLTGLEDLSSRPKHSPARTAPDLIAQVQSLRRERLCYDGIADRLGLSKATICRLLRACGLHRLHLLEPPPPVVRYERAAPGELIHFDIKKLGRIERVGHRITGNPRDHSRGAGWEFLHVVVDDHSRVAFAALMPNERHDSAIAFLHAALAFFEKLGVKVQRIMTDNGSCYKSFAFANACKLHDLSHRRTRPYRPQTNGKAERFIKTITNGWAYARAYQHSDEREAHLLPWLHRYNWHRPHRSLNRRPPISRLNIDRDNLLRLHT